MGWKDDVGTAKPSQRGVRIGEGTFLLKTEKCTSFKSRKGEEAFIVDFEIMESTSAEHPVGSKRNWYQQITGKDSAAGNIQSYAVAASGLDPTDEKRIAAEFAPAAVAIMDAACGDEQLFRGKLVRLVAKKDKTKPNPKGETFEFLRMAWAPYKA